MLKATTLCNFFNKPKNVISAQTALNSRLWKKTQKLNQPVLKNSIKFLRLMGWDRREKVISRRPVWTVKDITQNGRFNPVKSAGKAKTTANKQTGTFQSEGETFVLARTTTQSSAFMKENLQRQWQNTRHENSKYRATVWGLRTSLWIMNKQITQHLC